MTPSKLYILIVTLAFTALTAVFLFLPRSEYSNLEKRKLAGFPAFSLEKLQDARFTSEISHWFSDTEPFRDEFMAASMHLRDKMRFSFVRDEETISFHAVEDDTSQQPAAPAADAEIADYENHVNAEENFKIASAGIFIVGKVPNVRALNAFGGEASGGTVFASVVSEYAREFPGVNVYGMVIPLSSEFYTPDKAQKSTRPQLPFIKNIYSKLTDGARGVDAYTPLATHVEEPIYLRTDHHWAPLGAFYAAQAFAKVAGVPFRDLSNYDEKAIKGFVGSMYGYSKDMAVKNSPEDFIYYVAKGLNPATTYRDYKLNDNAEVIGESAPFKGNFFFHYKDGSSGAYNTFMGGDQRLTHIKTGTTNGRRLVLIKDSYGNPVPSFLFFSFEDIYVVDFRYFSHNMKKFVRDNNITDILILMNVFNAYSTHSPAKVRKFLTQGENSFSAPTPASAPSAPAVKEPQKAARPIMHNEEENEKPKEMIKETEKTSQPVEPSDPE